MSDTPAGPPPLPRRWEAPCPGCGAAVPFASAAAPYAICGYCRSTVVREGEALRRIGESAVLLDTRSRLQVGVSGRWAGHGFVLVGRVQFAYGPDAAAPDGTWTEWHALFDDGRSGWLSEDNDQYVFAFDREGSGGAPPVGALDIGQALRIFDTEWRVASITAAVAAAAEGELPTRPALGIRHPIVDLRNVHEQVATLDYQDPRVPSVAIGSRVRLADLALAGLLEGPDAGLSTLGGRAFACPACGASCEPLRADTRSMNCAACHALVDLSAGVGAELKAYQQKERIRPGIALGSVGRLGFGGHPPVAWQVVGFSVKRGREQDELPFTWRDYLLHNEAEGFAFLIDSSDGWVAYRTLAGVPDQGRDRFQVRWQGATFRLVAEYKAKVHYVEGEFYWAIRRDDESLNRDYEGSGAMTARRLSSEQGGSEVLWSEGSTVPVSAIRSAFGIAATTGPTDASAVDVGGMVGNVLDDIGPLSGSGNSRLQNIVWTLVVVAILIAIDWFEDDDGTVHAGGSSYSTWGGHK